MHETVWQHNIPVLVSASTSKYDNGFNMLSVENGLDEVFDTRRKSVSHHISYDFSPEVTLTLMDVQVVYG